MDPVQISATRTFRRNPQVEESPLQGELMLFEPEKGRFFVLNRTMAHLWQNCAGSKSLDAIVASVPEAFSMAPREQVEVDMLQALEELIRLGLVLSD